MSDKHLKDGLRRLPEYTPDGRVWENIDSELHLQTAIEQLPTYEPPETIWENISTELHAKPRVRRLWRRVAAVAAMFLLTIGTYWWTMSNDSIQEKIIYATETIDSGIFQEDWNTDEDGFQELAKLCSQKVFVCKQPSFQILKGEIDELNDAKASIEAAMKKYGKQAEFILQMKDIEQERSKVLKEMFAMI